MFNLDPHDKPGSHWISLFINAENRSIYYFDSTGEHIHKHIMRFVNEVQRQSEALGPRFSFDENHPVEHQFKNTECGMYTLFFIITMLKHDTERPSAHNVRIGKKIVGGVFFHDVFKNRQIKFADKQMEKLRNVYFNGT